MKVIIRRSGAEMPYAAFKDAVSVEENKHCIIVNTKKNRLMYSKPEFEMEEQTMTSEAAIEVINAVCDKIGIAYDKAIGLVWCFCFNPSHDL